MSLAVCGVLAVSVARADVSGIRINEIGWAPLDGSTGYQFVELAAITPGQSIDPTLFLDYRTAGDALVERVTLATGTQSVEGSQRVLAAGANLSRNAAFTSVFSTTSGAMRLVQIVGEVETEIDRLEWGPGKPLRGAPYRGQSYERLGDGTFTTQNSPTPQGLGFTQSPTPYGYAPNTGVRIDEFGVRCVTGTTVAFAEILFTQPGTIDPYVRLRTTDFPGGLVNEYASVLGSTGFGLAAAGTRVLVGTSTMTSSGLVLSRTMTKPSSTGGTLRLFRTNAVGDSEFVIHELPYGTAPGGVQFPPSGGSIVRTANDGFITNYWPSPTDPLGTNAWLSLCFRPAIAGVRVDELMLSCYSGSRNGWFLELANNGAGTTYPANLGMRFYDHDGALLYATSDLFAGRAGDSWPVNTHFLIAGAGFAGTAGLAPDVAVPTAPDTLGGRIEFVVTDGGTQVLGLMSEFRYGPGGSVAAPVHGQSAVFSAATGTYSLRLSPVAQNANSTTTTGAGCFGSGVVGFSDSLWSISPGCSQYGAATAYIELLTTPFVPLPARIALEIKDRTGTVTQTVPNIYASRVGQQINTSTARWLIGGAGYAAATGHTPDLETPLQLDPVSGEIRIYLPGIGGGIDVNIARYAWGARPLLMNLALLNRAYTTAWTPSNSYLVKPPQPNCFGDSRALGIQIGEAAFTCASGDTSVHYLEINTGSSGLLSNVVHLRSRDRHGVLLYDANPFGSAIDSLVPGTRYLLGGSKVKQLSGVTPNLPAPPLPADGGFLSLVMTNALGDSISVIDTLRVGVSGGKAMPPPGASISRAGVVVSPARPTNRRQQEAALAGCPGCAELSAASGPNWAADSFTASSDSVLTHGFTTTGATTSVQLNGRAGAIRIQQTVSMDTRSHGVINMQLLAGGLPLGTPFTYTARARLTGDLPVTGPAPQVIPGTATAIATVFESITNRDSASMPNDAVDWDRTAQITVPAVSGQLDDITLDLSLVYLKLTNPDLMPGQDLLLTFEIADLPKGAWVQNCQGLHAGAEAPAPLPVEPAANALRLSVVGGNPPTGALAFEVALHSGRDAELSLFDVAGRRVIRRSLGELGAGKHRVTLASRGALAPGVYLARLSEGAERRFARVTVVE